MSARNEEGRPGRSTSAAGDLGSDPLQLLTPRETAELLRVKPNTLAHARSGRGSLKLRVVWMGPKTPRYRRVDVMAFLESHTFTNTAQSHANWARLP